MDLPSRGGRAPGSQANGSFPKGTGRLSEKSPAGYPPSHHRDDTPGSAGVPPACCPFGCRSVSLRCCSRPPCRREPHGPGRSRGRAPLPVDSGGGDGRSCGRICAGGTPALPGGASSHDMVTPTGQKCRSILAPVVVEGGPSVLVTYLKQNLFHSYLKQNLFHSRMIRPVVGGGGPTCLKQILAGVTQNRLKRWK